MGKLRTHPNNNDKGHIFRLQCLIISMLGALSLSVVPSCNFQELNWHIWKYYSKVLSFMALTILCNRRLNLKIKYLHEQGDSFKGKMRRSRWDTWAYLWSYSPNPNIKLYLRQSFWFYEKDLRPCSALN